MYYPKKFCVFIILLGYLSLATVDALNCYQCNSHINPECADLRAHRPHTVASYHKPCDPTDSEGNKAFCRTISYEFKFLKKSDQDKTRVIRTCGYQKSNTPCYSVDNDHHLENVCQCFDDGCNSASNKSILSIISTLILVSTRWFIA